MDLLEIVKDFSVPLVILIIFFSIAWVFNVLFEKFLNKKANDARFDPTNYNFIRYAISTTLYLVGFSMAIYSIPSLRAVATSMLAGAGIVAVAVGFASQEALSNVISGIFLVIYKPFAINDRVEVNGLTGIVEDITLRHTVIRSYENKRIIIPNSVISADVIVNADLIEEKVCRILSFSISYESDVDLAKKIISEIAEEHPFCVDNRSPEQKSIGEAIVVVRMTNWAESSVELKAWVWAKNQGEGFVMHCDLLESIKKEFKQNGIEIPYPHRTIIQK